jgi:hypothetical protein
LGTFGVRRSSKTGFNCISVVQCVNRYPRTKIGIAVDRNNTKLATRAEGVEQESFGVTAKSGTDLKMKRLFRPR